MIESNGLYFKTSTELEKIIVDLTCDDKGEFKRRDFVKPLLDFCTNQYYGDKVGLVFGQRYTGKTVGMLQAAKELMKLGHEVAYASFKPQEASMAQVTKEIEDLREKGITHFFVDEAQNLSLFLTRVPNWSDYIVPALLTKIVISGADSFLLWYTKIMFLMHRHVLFETSFMSFPEYKRLTGKPYASYKMTGGIFPSIKHDDYIRVSLVENLERMLLHCQEAHWTNIYADVLLGIERDELCKSITYILKLLAKDLITARFLERHGLNSVLCFTLLEKQRIINLVANDIAINPRLSILPTYAAEMLLEVLVKTGFLKERTVSSSIWGAPFTGFVICQNAIMSCVIDEVLKDIEKAGYPCQDEMQKAIRDATDSAANESIIVNHVIHNAKDEDKIFKCWRNYKPKVDVVVISSAQNTLKLIDVSDSANPDVAASQAKWMLADHSLDDLAPSGPGLMLTDHSIVELAPGGLSVHHCIVVYKGESVVVPIGGKSLYLINIEEYLEQYQVLDSFLSQLSS